MKKYLFIAIGVMLFSNPLLAQSWSKLGSPNNVFYGNWVSNVLSSDNVGNIYVTGGFTDSISYTKGHRFVNKFDGINWQPLGHNSSALNPNSSINSLITDNSNNVYAAGNFTDSVALNKGHCYVAKWNGTLWSKLGTNANSLNANSSIMDMVINKANGHIYAIGNFSTGISSGLGEKYVAHWDGNNWSQLGSSPGPHLNGAVVTSTLSSIAIDKMGHIYVGVLRGSNPSTNFVAKWDGNNWSELGMGNNSLNANSSIVSICVDSKGNVYAGGYFTDSATISSGKQYVAKWDGNNWSKLGTGINELNVGVGNTVIEQLIVDNNDNIYASGGIRNNLGKIYVAKWDGSTWYELGGNSSFPGQNPISLNALHIDKFVAVYATGSIIDSTGNNYVARYGFPLGVENIKEKKNELVVYPNPVNNVLICKSVNMLINTIEVTDVLGINQNLKIEQQTTENFQLNTEHLPSGIYFIKATDVKGNVKMGKFVKE